MSFWQVIFSLIFGALCLNAQKKASTYCNPHYDESVLNQIDKINLCKKAHLGVFITTHANKKLGVYWHGVDFQYDANITVFDGNKSETKIINSSQGFFETSLKLDGNILERKTGSRFFEYTPYYDFRVLWGNLKVSLITVYPTWMEDNKNFLGNRRLNEIFIPGTYNSAAYNYINAPYIHKIGDFRGPYDGSTRIIHQDENILNQLRFGARYLDLKPIYNSQKNQFFCGIWKAGCLVPFISFDLVASQIYQFINNTNEIVILGLSEFKYFNNVSIHEEFIKYLNKQFPNKIIERNGFHHVWGSDLNALWKTNKQIIISYDYNLLNKRYAEIQNNPFEKSSLKKIWANTDNLDYLEGYLAAYADMKDGNRESENRNKDTDFPPTVTIAALKTTMYQKGLPEKVSYRMTIDYLTKEKWGRSANIVAVNFLLSTGIVNAALEWNEKRFKNLQFNEANEGK